MFFLGHVTRNPEAFDKCYRMEEKLERNANPENTRILKGMCTESGDNRKKGRLKERRKVLW